MGGWTDRTLPTLHTDTTLVTNIMLLYFLATFTQIALAQTGNGLIQGITDLPALPESIRPNTLANLIKEDQSNALTITIIPQDGSCADALSSPPNNIIVRGTDI